MSQSTTSPTPTTPDPKADGQAQGATDVATEPAPAGPSVSSAEQQSAAQPDSHSKPCALCHRPRDVMIRCRIDDTGKWYLICTGKCWKDASGGFVGGDNAHPNYVYGGMWKNKYAAVNAKIKGKAKEANKPANGVKSEIHNRRGKKKKKQRPQKDAGQMRIASDDGASDISVSDFGNDAEEDFEGYAESKMSRA